VTDDIEGRVSLDGVAFRSVEEMTNGAAKTRNIDEVYVSASGGVWLSTQSAGLLLWKDGKLTTCTDRRCTPSLKSGSVSEDQEGWLWVQVRPGCTGQTVPCARRSTVSGAIREGLCQRSSLTGRAPFG
jgi:ligand-binding sensor domain-containing protein